VLECHRWKCAPIADYEGLTSGDELTGRGAQIPHSGTASAVWSALRFS
jgi:hypothetical protein